MCLWWFVGVVVGEKGVLFLQQLHTKRRSPLVGRKCRPPLATFGIWPIFSTNTSVFTGEGVEDLAMEHLKSLLLGVDVPVPLRRCVVISILSVYGSTQ
jgi:hypothetical protein